MTAGTPSVNVEALIEEVVQSVRGAYIVTEDAVVPLPCFNRILGLEGSDRSAALLVVFRRIGALGRGKRPKVRGLLDWLNLHWNKEFMPCAIIAKSLLRSRPDLSTDEWSQVLSEISEFDAISTEREHEYLRPLVRQLERAWAASHALRECAAASVGKVAVALGNTGRAKDRRIADRFLALLSKRGVRSGSRKGTGDGNPQRNAAPHADPGLAGLLGRFVKEAKPEREWSYDCRDPKDVACIKEIDGLPPDRMADLLILATERVDQVHPIASDENDRGRKSACQEESALAALLAHSLRHVLECGDDAIDTLAVWTASRGYWDWRVRSIEGGLLRTMERRAKRGPLTPTMTQWLEGSVARWGEVSKPDHGRIARAQELLGEGPTLDLEMGEAWSDAAIGDIQGAPAAVRLAWMTLTAHCKAGRGSSPSPKWLRGAGQLVGAIGKARFVDRLLVWFPLVDRPRTNERERRYAYEPDWSNLIIDLHMEVLKGLCWIAGTIKDPDLARALRRVAISAYRKVPGTGPRAVKVGNAAVYALGQMPGMDAVGQLAMLRVKVKFGTAQKGIEKALNAAAEREGLPREEIEELGIPTYGLGEVGLRREEMGEFLAELEVTGIGNTELRFSKKGADGKLGKVQKSVPSAIKKDHAEDLKELKGAGKDIAAMLPAQRDRIDSLFLENKSWAHGVWRERYLDHPLVGVIARRLIWRIADRKGENQRSAAWLEETRGLVDAAGSPVKLDEDSAVVRLWHPIEVAPDEVLAWRRFFEERQVRQPFKQAHREVYLLTDAERRTGTYSNRFAAHVLRQHQFHALCAVRGWKNKLRLMVDAEYPPASRTLRAHGLRAEFWIEGAGEEVNESSAYLYLTTDQVRFYRIESADNTAHAGGGGYVTRAMAGNAVNEPLPVETIPPLVLSEVMRDVDLFVGVASVGNNPQWSDGGPEGRYREYWNSYAWGDLSETGKTRQEFLGRLLPRLKIVRACSLTDKFLIVRGKLRTYKIHLGSGNILMEPNDQYLCIVAHAGMGAGSDQVFLPFEGDRTLAIILSKAFMLATDDKIKDPSIVSQIGRGK